MPAVQTTYSTQSAARLGTIAEWNEAQVLVSRTVETAAGIGFGAVVQQGANDYGVKAIGDGSATSFLGITVRSQSQDANVGDKWAQADEARLMLKGVVWVTAGAGSSITAGKAVYYTAAGLITDVSTSATLIPNARFESTGAAGSFVKVRLG